MRRSARSVRMCLSGARSRCPDLLSCRVSACRVTCLGLNRVNGLFRSVLEQVAVHLARQGTRPAARRLSRSGTPHRTVLSTGYRLPRCSWCGSRHAADAPHPHPQGAPDRVIPPVDIAVSVQVKTALAGIFGKLRGRWQTVGVVFVADAFGAWLVGQLADAGRKKLTELILGSEQERRCGGRPTPRSWPPPRR